jgi:hypothetical protein
MMQRFRKGRCSEVVTAKILPSQRDFLEAQALARDVSICSVIRELINEEMAELEQKDVHENGLLQGCY